MAQSILSTYQSTAQIFNVFNFNRIVRRTEKKILSLPQKIILLDLADRFGKNGKVYPSNLQIAEATALPVKTVLNCLSDLKSKRFIFYEKQHNRNRRYISLFDPQAAIENYQNGIDQYADQLVPRLSLVGDSTIPDQGQLLIRTEQKNVPTTPLTPLQTDPPKPPPASKAAVVVVPDFEILKNRLRADLKPSFVKRTHEALAAKGLGAGQIKTLIDEMNASTARSCGWLVGRVKDLEDPAAIPDADEIAKQETARAEAARKDHDERMARLKVVAEKDNEAGGKKIEGHIETYMNLPLELKQLVFTLVLHKSKGEERKKQIMAAGADGLHEVDNIGFRIQKALGKINMPGKGVPGK